MVYYKSSGLVDSEIMYYSEDRMPQPVRHLGIMIILFPM
jgi:hypothetical protein